ncbi:putative AlkP superfamily pyrophosphatase or phosphodiesterase [Roseimicrobium gellanilyticum]|uniref:Putative AlkP superfamily pyrophosphatase or phosphodiesterase n=1 Tax=Roseimicrobium gellanilyticum TaxID=748857 RepID=A0A366HMG0_9BACT|nr:nucleotide pyrophosphatase/phosphodiesterase family protein [Roseimicrobium gellanilyticum]RBP44329.1 putative AlkP superfamily pyrophosphatase or phosphodiesterase [Roseimicrobium gellanilyticum]
MQRTAILNVVGLTPRLICEATPNIRAFMERNRIARVQPGLPAVTCTMQSTYLTGRLPRDHGIVGNGWYDREYSEHRFWKQSNNLVSGEKLWEALRRVDPEFTCAKLFWWYNMYSSADFSITPRPLYPADGRKVFDVHTQPMGMRERIKKDLGSFPFPHFWGPASSIKSTAWIAQSAKWVEERCWPSLNLVYLPHLDYDLQRYGPDMEKVTTALKEIDDVVGDLITFFENRSIKVILLSEYGITEVDRPVHLNRVFREKGWLSIKNELGRETLDLGGSKVVMIPDHQVAHIYLNDPSIAPEVIEVLQNTPGVQQILGKQEKFFAGLDHYRSGDLVVVSDFRSWFTYYYWENDKLAPDFARCVDIHRKPGYDPVELFLDPKIKRPKLKLGLKLAAKTMRLRTLFDVIPLDATLVKGSHGRVPDDTQDWPVLIGDLPKLPRSMSVSAHEVFGHLYEHCARGSGYGRVGV